MGSLRTPTRTSGPVSARSDRTTQQSLCGSPLGLTTRASWATSPKTPAVSSAVAFVALARVPYPPVTSARDAGKSCARSVSFSETRVECPTQVRKRLRSGHARPAPPERLAPWIGNELLPARRWKIASATPAPNELSGSWAQLSATSFGRGSTSPMPPTWRKSDEHTPRRSAARVRQPPASSPSFSIHAGT